MEHIDYVVPALSDEIGERCMIGIVQGPYPGTVAGALGQLSIQVVDVYHSNIWCGSSVE